MDLGSYAVLSLADARKQELTAARWQEFDLEQAVWHLPGERTKTGADLDIPLPGIAMTCLRELHRLATGSEWVLPARKAQDRMLPHIHENILNVALSKVKALLPDLEPPLSRWERGRGKGVMFAATAAFRTGRVAR